MVANQSEREHQRSPRCGLRIVRRRGGNVDAEREMFSGGD